jgi:tRNA dimethylallyltransferase
MPRAVLLMGPTASGKSRAALDAAARLPVEIVSVESAQVYLGMDVGTAKPSAEERAAVPHHLVDVMPPTGSYSAARFRDDALRLIADIGARGRVPLLVGGTMLYFKALIGGLSSLPAADARVRAEIDAEAEQDGWPTLHERLAAVDPVSADRIRPRDSQRIQRALEVYRLTGEPMSGLLASPRPATPASFVSIALVPSDRSVLHARIGERFDRMLANGLVEELRGLRRRYRLSPDLPSMRAVGYRQAWQHLEGELTRDGLQERGVYATRQLAKRQLTWLRSWQGAIELDALDPDVSVKVGDLVLRAAGV